MSRRVCEPRHENGSTEYRSAVCHLFFVLNSVTVSPQHVENFSRPLEMMHKMFSEGRTIVEGEQRSGQPSTTRTSGNTTRV